MTNELLVQLIGQGENDELLPLLWEKMRKYYRGASNTYYSQHIDICKRHSITADDLFQESYFSMLEAIKDFNRSFENHQESKFSVFCKFPFQKRADSLVGIRANSEFAKEEPLNNVSKSLDAPATTENGSDTDFVEILRDDQAENAADERYRKAETEYHSEYVRKLVKKVLSGNKELDRQREIIIRNYFGGETLQQIADSEGVPKYVISHIKKKAMAKLRNSHFSSDFVQCEYQHLGVSACLRDGSIVERIVEQREAMQYRNKLIAEITEALSGDEDFSEFDVAKAPKPSFSQSEKDEAEKYDMLLKEAVQRKPLRLSEIGKILCDIMDLNLFIILGYKTMSEYIEIKYHRSWYSFREFIRKYLKYKEITHNDEEVMRKLDDLGIEKLKLLLRLDDKRRNEFIDSGYALSTPTRQLEKEIRALTRNMVNSDNEDGDNEEDD